MKDQKLRGLQGHNTKEIIVSRLSVDIRDQEGFPTLQQRRVTFAPNSPDGPQTRNLTVDFSPDEEQFLSGNRESFEKRSDSDTDEGY